MSRFYRANVSIQKPTPGREKAIANALMDFWGFEEVETTPEGLVTEIEGSLCGGTSEDEFALELTQCVWASNEGFCEVVVVMTYLEDLPCEEYVFDSEDKYDEWLKASGEGGTVSS